MKIMENVRAKLAKRKQAQTTRNELQRLSEKELKDIGLTRGDIESIARGII